jgi:hypothetical protein
LAFFGRYFFADFGSSRLWSVRLLRDPASGEAVASGLTEHTLGMPIGNVSAFGLDASCEVYLVDYGGGRVLRVDPVAASAGSGCATPDPFLSLGGGAWVGGGWVPLDHPLAAGVGQIEPATSGGNTGTTPSATACVTPKPGVDWVCVNGGWVPPDNPLAQTAGTGGSDGTSTGGSTSGATCTTTQPASDWVCVNGGWLPPDHPLAVSGVGTSGSGTGSTSCTTPDPFVGIPGLIGACVNGGWVPRIIGGTP